MQAHSGLKQHGAIPDAILHPGSRSLFSYWNTLRGPTTAPRRQDIDLRAIAPILPGVGITERKAGPPRHCWRLVGTGIARLWGPGLTGTEVAADWPEVYRRSLAGALDGVTDRHQAFVARLKAVSADGDSLGIEMFAAPVEADDSSTQALCAMVAFRDPHWLGRVPLVDVELSTLAAVSAVPLPDEIKGVRSRAPSSLQLRLIRGGRRD